jgi:hypothetical protein
MKPPIRSVQEEGQIQTSISVTWQKTMHSVIRTLKSTTASSIKSSYKPYVNIPSIEGGVRHQISNDR